MRNAAIAPDLRFSYEAAAWVNVGRDKANGQRKKETGEVAEDWKGCQTDDGRPQAALEGHRIMLKHLSFFLVSLTLIGCSMTKGASANPKSDPLLGGPPIKPVSYTTPPNTQAIVPQSPAAPSNSMSTAELASGIHQPLDTNHDLRMGNQNNPNNQPPGDGWRPQGGSSAPSVALNRPEPIPDVDSRPMPGSGPNVMLTSGGAATGVDPLLDQLKARGMVWFKMEMNAETGEWDLSCAIPNRQNPDVQRTYEVRAKDPASGLRAVIERIDRDR
jgi:hypothetical protein